ncbi:hypothetical protein PInf_007132 [Phytophthora infestans]|nr:hypothetical protein PInf_007132 [Phytophthora infestans]
MSAAPADSASDFASSSDDEGSQQGKMLRQSFVICDVFPTLGEAMMGIDVLDGCHYKYMHYYAPLDDFDRKMLRISCVSATRHSNAYRSLGRSIYSAPRLQKSTEAADTICSSKLRLGVLGLGAIGTIFFTRLGRLATSSEANRELPTLTLDALIKPERFDNWVSKEKLQLCLQGPNEEILEFRLSSSKKMAVLLDTPNVRVRTLDSEGKDGCDDKLDVLLVAVKAYDNVGVIRELRDKNKHLLKDDALCVLLQNGLGEVPEETTSGSTGVEDRWQFANGVTFVGGRVAEFGIVVASGLDVGMTYLAPFGGSERGLRMRKEHHVKMNMLAQLLLAAGMELWTRKWKELFKY